MLYNSKPVESWTFNKRCFINLPQCQDNLAPLEDGEGVNSLRLQWGGGKACKIQNI